MKIEIMLTKVNAAEFHELLKRDEQFVVKFGAGWCGPCKVLKTQLEEVENEVFEIDIDQVLRI
jgi:thiol-disulfide isomerase/thioredoxin